MSTYTEDSGKKHISNARKLLRSIFQKALDAVDPYTCILNSVQLCKHNVLRVTDRTGATNEYNLDSYNNVNVVGCGKAGAPMAAAIEDILGSRIKEGVVTVKRGYLQSKKLLYIAIGEAGHPVPDQKSVSAAEKTISLLVKSGRNDLVVALLSGGGSSLWSYPVDGVTLEDMISLNRILLASGASIVEINTLRKQISRIKGGKSAKAAFPATVLVLEVSDVIGNDPAVIASGPFFPDNSSPQNALQVIDKYGIAGRIPLSIHQYLINSLHNIEVSHQINNQFSHVTHCICADNRKALLAAAYIAEQHNYRVTVLDKTTCGEAKDAAVEFIKSVKEVYNSFPGEKHCIIAGGETTVTLGDEFGIGGRNQEFALAAAIEMKKTFSPLADSCSISLLSCGSDGTDGTTDAAGAIVDLSTIISDDYDFTEKAIEALKKHNAYPFFTKTNSLVKTGPTNTNVMDIQITLIDNIM